MTHFQTALADGVFTLESVITALRNEGYIMEGRGTIGSRCTRTLITAIAADFENHCHENAVPLDDGLRLSSTATDVGSVPGDFRYIVYNSRRYTPKQAIKLLVAVNRAEQAIRDLENSTR